ncbi:cytochrome P450 [Setomelanomma holmii]|uniref:Cytochrome P450 n=1 Tax=Setomelanomma holmii TaxID=210430 RepID=A0A9P4GVQ9_9PLEO|nr:cytochrome P450 [Setomelanomma holmii]
MLTPAAQVYIAPAFILYILYYVGSVIFHPLARIPCAHPASLFSTLWILWKRYQGVEQEIAAVSAAHLRHGPVVRLGPREISVGSLALATRLAQVAKLEKPNWYLPFTNFRHSNCMSSLDARSHAIRRRRVTQPYLQSSLHRSAKMKEIMVIVLYDRLTPELSRSSDCGVDVLPLCFAIVMDIVSAHTFGLAVAPDLTGDKGQRHIYLEAFREAITPRSMFWAQEVPLVSYLYPFTRCAWKAKSSLERNILDLCRRAEDISRAHQTESPGLYHFLRESSPQHVDNNGELEIASEVLDHLKATGDVLSITLAHALYELSKNCQIQMQLRSELHKSWGLRDPEGRDLPSPKSLHALPLLDAVVCETLRLRPTAPDGQPRINKSTSTVIHGCSVPMNVRISTYSYILHHDETFFENAQEWDPSRWTSQRLNQNVHSWAYGVGARACLGKHMATLLLKNILAFIYTFYKTKIIDDSKWRLHGEFARLDDALSLSFTSVS